MRYRLADALSDFPELTEAIRKDPAAGDELLALLARQWNEAGFVVGTVVADKLALSALLAKHGHRISAGDPAAPDLSPPSYLERMAIFAIASFRKRAPSVAELRSDYSKGAIAELGEAGHGMKKKAVARQVRRVLKLYGRRP